MACTVCAGMRYVSPAFTCAQCSRCSTSPVRVASHSRSRVIGSRNPMAMVAPGAASRMCHISVLPRGKTEMWHILEAAPGATIAMGFREPITRERLWEATRTGEVEHLLRWAPVEAGETYLIPAHTVHAIGAGIVLCEIQQNSDVTYRLWDYGRPREIHVEKAVPICDLGVHPGASRAVPVSEGREEVARSKHLDRKSTRLNSSHLG